MVGYFMKKYLFVMLAAFGIGFLIISQLAQPDASANSVADTEVSAEAELLANVNWTFEETFDGDPDAPSQDLLPRTIDYAATHRVHAKELFDPIADTFPADHADNCAGPNPDAVPLPQHDVISSNNSNGSNPDPSFYICKNHMMSSAGEIAPYSLTSFWSKKVFNFADGGIIEFDVNVNDIRERMWWEMMIMPRDQLKINSARHFFPIDEIYPKDHIVFDYHESRRRVQVGKDSLDSYDGVGVSVDERRPLSWAEENPDDPANGDRRIRRRMRFTITDARITWEIEKADGSFSAESWDLPEGLPFEEGLIVIKSHAYTPTKFDNLDNYTFHWDNLRFSGGFGEVYNDYEADAVVYLEANGNRPIGDSQTVTITLPDQVYSPMLFGQLHNPMTGQVLLSINGGEQMVIHPPDYVDGDLGETNCHSDDWKAFTLPLDVADLRPGEANTFEWTVGPRPDCAAPDYPYNGFSVKDLEIQSDKPPTFLPLLINR